MEDLKYKNKSEGFKASILGFLIGLAVIIPGISGSTISIMFKLYEKLLYAMGNIFKKFKACFIFLLPIVIGAVVGLLVGFLTIRELLNTIPFLVILLFIGLMIGAFPVVNNEIKGEAKTPKRIILYILGLIIPVALALSSLYLFKGDRSLADIGIMDYIIFFILGYLISVTQLVPGLSATALLMALGYFNVIINAISVIYLLDNLNVLFLFVIMFIGVLVGLITFSKLMNFGFAKAKKTLYFLINGLSLGSIIAMFMTEDIIACYKNMEAWQLICGIVLMVLGFGISYYFAKKEIKG